MRKVILLVFSIIIVLLVIAVFFILNRPAARMSEAEKQKALTQIVGRKLNLGGSGAVAGDIIYKGKYYSLLYPGSAKIYKHIVNGVEVKDEGVLDIFSFDLEGPKLNIVTQAVEASSLVSKLSDFPAVSMRQAQSNLYKESQIKESSGISGVGFAKQEDNSFEKTAFFYVNGRIYSVSVAGADDKAVGELYGKLISSLKLY